MGVAMVLSAAIFCAIQYQLQKQQTRIANTIKKRFRASVSLATSLGLTWASGLLMLANSHVAFQWIFVVLVGTQGIAIFFFQVVYQPVIQRKMARVKTSLQELTRENVLSSRGEYNVSEASGAARKRSVASVLSFASSWFSSEQHSTGGSSTEEHNSVTLPWNFSANKFTAKKNGKRACCLTRIQQLCNTRKCWLYDAHHEELHVLLLDLVEGKQNHTGHNPDGTPSPLLVHTACQNCRNTLDFPLSGSTHAQLGSLSASTRYKQTKKNSSRNGWRELPLSKVAKLPRLTLIKMKKHRVHAIWSFTLHILFDNRYFSVFQLFLILWCKLSFDFGTWTFSLHFIVLPLMCCEDWTWPNNRPLHMYNYSLGYIIRDGASGDGRSVTCIWFQCFRRAESCFSCLRFGLFWVRFICRWLTDCYRMPRL